MTGLKFDNDGAGTFELIGRGVANLQEAYEGGSEIITDLLEEDFIIQGGTGTDTDINFTIKNNAGAVTASIAANGNAIFNNIDPTGVVTIFTNNLELRNPADTFSFRFATTAITANRTITIPKLVASDTLPFLDHGTTIATQDWQGHNKFRSGSGSLLFGDNNCQFGSALGRTVQIAIDAGQSVDTTLSFPSMDTTDIFATLGATQTFTSACTFDIDIAIGSGGTGASTNTAAFNNLSPVTTLGDIIFRDASNNVRLAIGSNGDRLEVSGGTPTWITPALPTPDTWSSVLINGRTSGATNPQLTTSSRLEFRDANNYFFSSATNITNMVTAGSFRMGTTTNYASVDSTGVLTFVGTGGYGVAINVPAFFVSIAVLAGITFATIGGNRIKTTDTLGADLSASWLGGGALGGNGGFKSTHGFAKGETVVAQITANINNTTIFADTGFAIITSDAARNVTGAGRPNNTGILSRETHIYNNGSFTITFTDQDAASTATNRFKNVTVPGANMLLAAGEGLMIQYSPSIGRWLMEKK